MTTPITPFVALPAAMVEAAARSRCERESGPFGVTWDDEDLGDYRAQLLAEAADDLAAALGVCEIEWSWVDEHGARWSMGGPEDCNCGAYGGQHWQSATARSGQGSLYCGPGQRHEPAEPDPNVGQP